ncbi:MAG: ankyrin repeat domain-containing protein [Chlamydiota bacterium]
MTSLSVLPEGVRFCEDYSSKSSPSDKNTTALINSITDKTTFEEFEENCRKLAVSNFKIRGDNRTVFDQAVICKNIKLAGRILNKNPELINYGGVSGRTVLFDVIAYANQANYQSTFSKVRILLELNADVNIATVTPSVFFPEGSTPLYAAAKTGHVKVIRLLLNRGAIANPAIPLDCERYVDQAIKENKKDQDKVSEKVYEITTFPREIANLVASFCGGTSIVPYLLV